MIDSVVKRKFDQVKDDDYLSDESEFYGSPATKRSLENRTRSFNPKEWWENHAPYLNSIAIENNLSIPAPPKLTPYNPYEGVPSARQNHESVEDFLERMPPATTYVSENLHWIWVANPFRQRPTGEKEKEKRDGNGNGKKEKDLMQFETMESYDREEEDQGVAAFMRKGGRILEGLTRLRFDLEKEFPAKGKGAITRLVGPRREEMVVRLQDIALECGVVGGKWMIFCYPSEVNEVWEVIVKAVMKDELGTVAKVAPNDGDERTMRLICVYTKHFKDIADITRVCANLKKLGVIGPKGIHYKCDAYTYLDIKTGNEWGIKPSMYNSTDILKAKSKGVKAGPQSLSSKKRKDDEDWKQLESE